MGSFQTVLIGNGLGRTIDNDFFSLGTAINKSWSTLTPDQQNDLKTLLCVSTPPDSEDQMQTLHEILEPLQQLLERAPAGWLTDHAKNYLLVVSALLVLIPIRD